ncbi:hypothetical protein ROHU_004391 [Labeo rohita]|uniref:Uncharacterized protein n=1 Tax=Labeo rohita TaxID=84645 RepID=A0A498NMD6_LABRO|nr:hypothetical protein ROHU_004391 [Labeo rohita]
MEHGMNPPVRWREIKADCHRTNDLGDRKRANEFGSKFIRNGSERNVLSRKPHFGTDDVYGRPRPVAIGFGLGARSHLDQSLTGSGPCATAPLDEGECVDPLDLRNLVSISMDGPNVNFKCFELFQQELTERLFSPFLKKYQTEEPVMPFFSNDLAELIKSLLRRFVRRDILQDITTLQLTKLDVTDKNNWLQPKDIDIGLGAESVLKVV